MIHNNIQFLIRNCVDVILIYATVIYSRTSTNRFAYKILGLTINQCNNVHCTYILYYISGKITFVWIHTICCLRLYYFPVELRQFIHPLTHVLYTYLVQRVIIIISVWLYSLYIHTYIIMIIYDECIGLNNYR